MRMSLNQAYNILEMETLFLGVHWDKLMYLLKSHPGMFPQRALSAYDRVMQDRE